MTGSLMDSLNADIETASGDISGLMKLHFTDHGRFQDMKYAYAGKMPPVSAMLEFIRKKGLANFKYVPGYPMGVMPIGTTKSKYAVSNRIAENLIAWGLAMSRVVPKNASMTYGKRKWYAKTVFGSIDDLISLLMQRTKERTTEEIIQSFQ
jgi:hypothetical protein